MIEYFYLNEKIFLWLHSFVKENDSFNNVFIFFGENLIYILIFLFFIFLFWQKKNILIKLLGVVGLWGMTKGIRFFLEVPRPFIDFDFQPLISENDLVGSFPSGHSTLAFAIAWTVFLTNRKLGILFLIGAILVGLGRILVGVHYPLDVLGGFIIAGFGVFLIYKIVIIKYGR